MLNASQLFQQKWNQQRLIHGYCRLMHRNYIHTDIISIIEQCLKDIHVWQIKSDEDLSKFIKASAETKLIHASSFHDIYFDLEMYPNYFKIKPQINYKNIKYIILFIEINCNQNTNWSYKNTLKINKYNINQQQLDAFPIPVTSMNINELCIIYKIKIIRIEYSELFNNLSYLPMIHLDSSVQYKWNVNTGINKEIYSPNFGIDGNYYLSFLCATNLLFIHIISLPQHFSEITFKYNGIIGTNFGDIEMKGIDSFLPNNTQCCIWFNTDYRTKLQSVMLEINMIDVKCDDEYWHKQIDNYDYPDVQYPELQSERSREQDYQFGSTQNKYIKRMKAFSFVVIVIACFIYKCKL